MVRSAARLQADPARRQLGEELRHRTAPRLRPHHRCSGLFDPMHLKDMLGGVQTNPDNPHRTAPLLDCTITAWHYRCRRGPSTPTSGSKLGNGKMGLGLRRDLNLQKQRRTPPGRFPWQYRRVTRRRPMADPRTVTVYIDY